MEDVIMVDEVSRFRDANKRVNLLGKELIGRDLVVYKSSLGYFHEEGEIDELVCKVIGYDENSFKVTHEDLRGKTEEVENYVLYRDLIQSYSGEDEDNE